MVQNRWTDERMNGQTDGKSGTERWVPHLKIKKQIQSIFPENELKITIQCNFKIVDYLDVTFNLTDSSFRLFNKIDNDINYIDKQSNHACSIIKQLLFSVERPLSKLSSN